MKNGFVVEEGNGVIVLTRAAGVSEEFFTRGKEFVPERYSNWASNQEYLSSFCCTRVIDTVPLSVSTRRSVCFNSPSEEGNALSDLLL